MRYSYISKIFLFIFAWTTVYNEINRPKKRI